MTRERDYEDSRECGRSEDRTRRRALRASEAWTWGVRECEGNGRMDTDSGFLMCHRDCLPLIGAYKARQEIMPSTQAMVRRSEFRSKSYQFRVGQGVCEEHVSSTPWMCGGQ